MKCKLTYKALGGVLSALRIIMRLDDTPSDTALLAIVSRTDRGIETRGDGGWLSMVDVCRRHGELIRGRGGGRAGIMNL